MSLNWSWSSIIGECTDKKGVPHYIYPCNGLLVVLNEYKEHGVDYYCMYDFRFDWQHEKNCVEDGIQMFEDMTEVKIDYDKLKVYFKKTEVPKLLEMFYKAEKVVLVKNYEKGELEDIEELNKRMRV